MRTLAFMGVLIEGDPPTEEETLNLYVERIVREYPVELHESTTVAELAESAYWEAKLVFLKGEDDDE